MYLQFQLPLANISLPLTTPSPKLHQR